ncbi:MAG TPA: response regulator transcription factor [Steroidobacteraceae bacterium]
MGDINGGTAGVAQTPRLRLIIGENNADLALTLSMLLDAEPDIRCVGTASSNSAVLEALEAHAPNAFVLDLTLDDGSSLPLIATLRARAPQAVIVVYTGHKNQLLDQQCLQSGADAVVVKSGDIDELTAALRRAAQCHPAPGQVGYAGAS